MTSFSTHNGGVGRVVAVLAIALCACHRAPSRIYTDKELADLEQRVMAEVAKTDPSCSHQELLDLDNAVDEPCSLAISKVRRDADAESVEIWKIDEQCAPKVLEAFGRAAATSPGCSPYQVGVRGDPALAPRKTFQGALNMMRASKVLAWHALRETDHYVGLMELLMALNVAQDLGRGRVGLLEAMISDAMANTVASAAQKLLSQSSLTVEQLGDAVTMLDAALSHEPSLSSALEGDAVFTALHMGVAALKPNDWQPPGGRTDITASKGGHATPGHDSRDDAGALMDTAMRSHERLIKDCPPSASLATCHANLAAHDSPSDAEADLTLTDRHAARVAMFPDDKTRRESQEQIVAALAGPNYLEDYVGKRAWSFSRLVALRLQLQVLIDGHCPSDAQLSSPPWSTLRAPAVLGDSVRVTRTDDAMLVEAPTWATTSKVVPKGPPFPPPLPKPQPVSIPCP